MDIKRFLMNHGEKIILFLVVVLCIWSVYATVTNEETRTIASDDDLKTIYNDLTAVDAKPGTPNFLPVRRFDDEVMSKLAIAAEAKVVEPWLVEHPDMGASLEIPFDDPQPYVFEVGKPEFESKDLAGEFELIFKLPVADRANESRDLFKDGLKKVEWEYSRPTADKTDTVKTVNSAEVVALQVQVRSGDGQWDPYTGEGFIEGVKRLGGDVNTVTSRFKVEEGVKYFVRWRLIVRATGYSTITGTESAAVGEEVLIVSPPLEDASSRNIESAKNAHAKQSNKAPLLPDGLPNISLRPKEKLYAGIWCGGKADDAEDGEPLSPGFTFRLALIKVSAFPGVPTVARFHLTRQYKQANGDTVWTVPKEYKVELDEKIGDKGPVTLPNGKQIRYDLSTPFRLRKVNTEAMRIWYYEVARKVLTNEATGAPITDEEGRSFRQFQMKLKKVRTELVEVENTIDKTTLTYVRLVPRLAARAKRDTYFFPILPNDGMNEVEEFAKDPALFELPVLEPARPVEHKDRKLLGRLVKAGLLNKDKVADIELPYFEMPDGRVIFWDTLEEEIRVELLPGSDLDRNGFPVEPEGPPEEEAVEGEAEAP